MSNLGNYQLMTTLAKKVGGPVGFLVTTLSAGYLIGKTAEAGGKLGVGAVMNTIKTRKAQFGPKNKVFVVRSDGTDNQGLEFKVGNQYRVLERDDDAVQIELIGDETKPLLRIRGISIHNLRLPCAAFFWRRLS